MQRILIVDDIEENLYLLEVLLKGNGFVVDAAHNGVEALEIARKTPPDLLVSDILMPVMDGYTLCREWRLDERLRRIPLIFYTATFVEKKDEQLALAMGADRFVIKPQEPEVLMTIIREMLADSRSKIQPSVEAPQDEKSLLKDYSEALFRKLEKKMADLERVNQELQDEIFERKRAEKERAEMQIHMIQQDKIATIGQLAAGVAHEINNPIGFIKSNLETLVKYTDRLKRFVQVADELVKSECGSTTQEMLAEERSKQHIDTIVRDISPLVNDCLEGSERIISIVKDLKMFTHHDVLETNPIDINSCCDKVISIIWNEIKYIATMHKEYSDIPLVLCNSQQISQVLINLLVNAVHAIKDQGDISIRTWSDQGSVFLSVSDTGCGIPSQDLSRIFDAFYTTKEVGKSTGLGLSISSEIVRKHGGEILVASEVDVGSTFTVRLPLKPPQSGDIPQ
jgi:signal transduction histidine kinase